MKKRYIKLGIALLGAVGTAAVAMSPALQVEVEADELPSISNVVVSGDTVTWDEFSGAHHYEFSISTSGSTVFECSANLKEMCYEMRLDSGSYTVKFYAYDSEYNKISQTYEFQYDYTTESTKLATPTNITITGNKIEWDPVPNATEYVININNTGFPRETNVNYIYLTGLKANEEFYVSIYANCLSFDYLKSEKAISDKYTITPKATLTDSNVSIDDKGIVTMPEIEGLSYYEISAGFVTNTENGTTGNLMKLLSGYETGNYNIKITAFDENDCPLTESYTTSFYYDSTKGPQVLTGTATVTGTLKYGETVKVEFDTNNTGNLSYTWFKENWYHSVSTGLKTESIVITEDLIGYSLYVIVESDYETGSFTGTKSAVVEKADGPAAPTTVSKEDCKTESQNDGSITGVTSDMEYKTSTGEWTSISGTSVTGLANGTYYVRYKETSTTKASDAVSVVINEYVDNTKYTININSGSSEKTESSKGVTISIKANSPAQGYVFDKWVSDDVEFANANNEETTFVMPKKNVSIAATYKAAPLTGGVTISGDCTYGSKLTGTVTGSNNTGNYSYQWYRGTEAIDGATESEYILAKDDIGRTLKLVVTSDVQTGEISSPVTASIAKKDTSVPTGITTTACTTASNNDGTITNVTNAMEYSTDGTSWTTCDASSIEGLANGTYYIRYKETETNNPSANLTVVVNAYEAPAEYGVTVVNGTADVATSIEGETIHITANTPATGKHFAYWETSDASLADDTAETTRFTMPGKAVTITAIYSDIEYSITFNANGGTGSMTEIKKTYNESFALPECTLTAPAGKQFKCWKLNDAEKEIGTVIAIKGSIELVAVWEDIPVINYTVSFDSNSGTGSMVAIETNGDYTLPACTLTAPAGKQFKCWKVNNVEYTVGSVVSISANTTISAVWEDKAADANSTNTDTTANNNTSNSTNSSSTNDSTNTTTNNSDNDGLSGGAIAAIVIASVLTLVVGAYFILGFTLYKKGKLKGKFFDTIYKWIKK